MLSIWQAVQAIILAPALYVPMLIIAAGLGALRWRRQPVKQPVEVDEIEDSISKI